MPVVWLPTARTIKQIKYSLVALYGVPIKGRPTEIELMESAMEQVRHHQTQIIVLDDVHNLRGKDAGSELKVLYETLGQVMFLFTRTFDNADAFDPKKGGTQTLERTVFQTVTAPTIDSKDWKLLLGQFEKALPLCHSSKWLLRPHLELLHERTQGKTGRLAHLLSSLTYEMIQTNDDGEDALTESMIKAVSMTNNVDEAFAA